MIHKFGCENFYSFRDASEVSFIVNEKAPDSTSYLRTNKDVRLSKIETIIGPNASGKTTLLKVLPFIKWLIVDSFSTDLPLSLPVKPFIFSDNSNLSTRVWAEFEVKDNLFRFDCSLTEQRIESEELSVISTTNKRETLKRIYSKKWSDQSREYVFKDYTFNLPKELTQSVLRSNATVLSCAKQSRNETSICIVDYWRKVEHHNINEKGWRNLSEDSQIFQALDFYYKNPEYKKLLEEILKKFDVGTGAFNIKKIEKEDKEDKFLYRATLTHKNKSGTFENLLFRYESSGTKQLISLLPSILTTLHDGGVAVVDELDTSLHPEVTEFIVRLFESQNTNNAQLLFGTHNQLILNQLDKYQIHLVEKDEDLSSDVFRLDEIDGVRPDDNYFKKYLAGAYGAIRKLE